jgi:acetyl-CoA carboxylase carboxyltransferase component
MLEVSERWARNMVTAFARIEGESVGIIANQPKFLGGTIDAEAAQKAARFVRTCNSFGLPLVVFVDTPGFLPGTRQEQAGVIRHGAKLLHAFAEATVPKLTVVLRKAFGGAYITMNSKDLGADLYLAWTRAELGIMGAEQAVGVVHRRALAAAADPEQERRRLAEAYAGEHLSAEAAARMGAVDEVIRPPETRGRLAWALSTLGRTREPATTRNIPL